MVIKAVAEYNQNTDQLVGCCGVQGQKLKAHNCLQESTIVVGDDQDSYNRLRNDFQN